MCKKLPPPGLLGSSCSFGDFFLFPFAVIHLLCLNCGKRRNEHCGKHYIALRGMVEKDEVPVKQACYYANTGKVTF